MKIQLLAFLILSCSFACKSKKETAASVVPDGIVKESSPSPSTTGTVSHLYRSSGCKVIIRVKNAEGNMTLIPKDELDKEYDVEGLLISFDYQLLKMPQPEGCTEGIPASIFNIKKK